MNEIRKGTLLLLVGLLFVPTIRGAKIEDVKPGELEEEIKNLYSEVTNLKVSGVIDARDLGALRLLHAGVRDLDLSETRVAAYDGPVAAFPGRTLFLADELPSHLFFETELSRLCLPSGITVMGVGLCAGSRNLKEIWVSDGTTAVSDYAFYGCSSLTDVRLPNSLSEIGTGAFGNCGSLATLNLSATSVTALPDRFVAGATSLRDLRLPRNLVRIGSEAFEGTALNALSLSGLQQAGEYALAGMPALQSVSLNGGAQLQEGTLADNPALIRIEGSPADIPALYLANAPKAQLNAVLANAESIGAYAFTGNEATSLILGPTLEYLDRGVLANAGLISYIDARQLRDRIPSLAEEAFTGLDQKKIQLLVAADTDGAWKQAEGWKEFDVVTSLTIVVGLDEMTHAAKIQCVGGQLTVETDSGIRQLAVYTVEGLQVASAENCGLTFTADLTGIRGKVAVVQVTDTDGFENRVKILVQ